MTQEIKSKLKQAAETAWEQDQKTNPSPVNPHAYVYGYKAGAKTVLENPSEWGLHLEGSVKEMGKLVLNLQSKLTKYREVLVDVVDELDSFNVDTAIKVAKEALKQGEK